MAKNYVWAACKIEICCCPQRSNKVSQSRGARRRSLPKMPEITLQLPSLKPSDKLGIFITNDFRIRKTNPGSIGEQAGFLAGDLLVSIDELRITKGMDKLTIASTMRGDPSKVQAPKSIVVTRETPEDEDEQGWHTDPEDSHENAKKDEEGEDKDEGLVTLSVPSMPVGVRMGLSVAAGNVVRSVDPGSYAELAGFRTSDVVVSVGGVPMAGVEKLEVATRIRGDRTAITRPCKVLVRRSAANSAAVAEAAQLKLPAEESADVAAEAARAAKAPIGLIGAALEKAPVMQSQGIVDVSSAGVNVNGQFSGAVPPPSAVVASDNTVAEIEQRYAELKRDLGGARPDLGGARHDLRSDLAAAVASKNYALASELKKAIHAAELQKTVAAAESRLDAVGQSGRTPLLASTGSSTRPRGPASSMPIAAMDRGEVQSTEEGDEASALELAIRRRASARMALDTQLSISESKATRNPDRIRDRISSLEAGDPDRLRRWQESGSDDWNGPLLVRDLPATRVELEMDEPLLALSASASASAASASLASVQIHMSTKMGGDVDMDGRNGFRNGSAAPPPGWTALVAQAHAQAHAQALQTAPNVTHAPSLTLETQLLITLLGRGEILPPDLISLQQAFEQASLKGLHSGLKVVHFPEHVNINVNKQPLASVHTTLPPPPGRRTSGTAPSCATDDLD
jgi:hypothetical protein